MVWGGSEVASSAVEMLVAEEHVESQDRSFMVPARERERECVSWLEMGRRDSYL